MNNYFLKYKIVRFKSVFFYIFYSKVKIYICYNNMGILLRI